MPEDPKFFTLPEREELLRRLMSVSDQPHYIERFYPLILLAAGREQTGMGVVMMLELAIADYTAGMPAVIEANLRMLLDNYVTALIDDEDVRAEALEMTRTVRAMVEGR